MSEHASVRLLTLTLWRAAFPAVPAVLSFDRHFAVVQVQFTAKMLACTAILTGVHDPFQPKIAVPKEETVPTITMAAATPASAGGAPAVAARPSVLPPPRGVVPVGGIGGMGSRPFSTPAAKPEIEEAEDEFDDDE